MNRPMLALFALLGTALLTQTAAADPECEINVNIAMTEQGRKVAPPSAAAPTYYFPLVAGFRELGEKVANEKAPPIKPIVHHLAKALASQHYLVVDEKHREPSLLLVLYWGYMNPQIEESGDPDNPQKIFFNQREMVSLLGGQTLGMLDLDFEREAVMQGAEDNRYFVLISAYDFAAAKQHKKVLLWQARMSTPSGGVSLEDVAPALIAAGGPMFGRETLRPKWVTLPVGPAGKVEVGAPEFKNYVDQPEHAPAPAVSKPNQTTPPSPPSR